MAENRAIFRAERAEKLIQFFRADRRYYDAVLRALEEGITTGTSSTTFSPNASCTRAQIVTFLYRTR